MEHTVILSEGGLPRVLSSVGYLSEGSGFAVKTYWTYILTNVSRKTLYTGVTSTIVGRAWQHKNKVFSGFASRYRANRLVYFEALAASTTQLRAKRKSRAGFEPRKLR